MRAIVHYLLAVVIFLLYGVQVCPFLESLTPIQLGFPVLITLALQWLVRQWWLPKIVSAAPFEQRVKRALIGNAGLFVLFGSGLALFNWVIYGPPLESGMKVLLGFSFLGFFIAIDLALEEERKLALYLQQIGIDLHVEENLFPVSRKLQLFAAASATLLTVVMILVINKDLLWLSEVNDTLTLESAKRSILIEFSFVAAVVLAHVINVIYSYAQNLRLFFDVESSVLVQTNQGDFGGRVPVTSHDEFGVIARHTNLMVEAIDQRTQEIQRTQDVTIFSLASLAETRDNETGAHILRPQRYVRVLAEYLAQQERYRDALDERTIDLLFKSAPLHDIGKVGIPDAILLKPGKLTDDEFAIMKTHPMLGSEALVVAEKELGGSSFLRVAREIIETHHEKWDGSGYPKGLKGKEIPLSGRLMALADVYDALISKRVYKPAFSHEKARSIILEGRGKHFDPDVVDAFIAVESEFQTIAGNHSDEAYAA
ncbi:MAG: HD domain-containing protein [Chromatiales bacterium]|nr:HD domain-containing protein [Chromatiales bacterium]